MPRSRWSYRQLRKANGSWDIPSGIFASSRCRVFFGGFYRQTTGDNLSYKYTVVTGMNRGTIFIAIFSKFGINVLYVIFLRFCAPVPYPLNPCPAGVFSRTRPAGGHILPPCLTPELIGAARRARRRSKALNEKIPMHFKNFL